MNGDEQWLDDLLANPPHIRENNFVQQSEARIKQFNRRRQYILLFAWALSIAIIFLVAPWQMMMDWLGILGAVDISVDNALFVVKHYWLSCIAVMSIIGVMVKNTVFQNT